MTNQQVSFIIPAYNEERWIGSTLKAVCGILDGAEVIVVDDGSNDKTADVAEGFAVRVIRHPLNLGKGASFFSGASHASHPVVCCLDADLGSSASYAVHLLEPIWCKEADMTIAVLPKSGKTGGFGFVKWTAVQGVYRLTGKMLTAPLSGQRALRRSILEDVRWVPTRFGLEVGLSIQLLRAGYRVKEVAVPFSHREHGRDWHGFLHRGREWKDVMRALVTAYREGTR